MSKENYPPFSVLMSVYKNERPEYLDASLKSIENQTVHPSEIIIVEDGPVTNELSYIIQFHKRAFGTGFKNIKLKKNRGLGEALRIGTRFVSTDWIARMDSDDYSVPRRFEIQMNIIKKDPELAVVGSQVSEFEHSISNIIGYRKVPTNSETIYDFVKWRSPFNHPSVLINKKKLIKVGGYIPFGNLEDYYLWARIICNGYKVVNTKEMLVLMRTDKGMYSRRGKSSNIIYFYKLREYLYKHNIVSLPEKLFGDLIATINILLPNWIRKRIYQKVLHRK